MAKFADQWEPNGPFGIVTDANMSGGYRVVTDDADKSTITILPPERQKVGMLVYVSATSKTWRLTTVGVRSPGTESYSSAPVFEDVSGGGIGGSVGGGLSTRVLFIGSDGTLSQSDNLLFDDRPSFLSLRVGQLYLDGANTNIYPLVYGSLSIGNDPNTATIMIGTSGNDDSVVIGREGGPATLIDSDLDIPAGSLLRPKGGLFTSSLTPLNINTALGAGKVVIGTSALGVDVSGPATFSGLINANGGIGISAGTGLNLGNDATITSGINIGTASATGGVAIGSGTNAVTIGGLLNADGGIGRSTNGTLNIGNDANVSGLNIGTSLATGGVTLGSSTNIVTIGGTAIIGATVRPDVDGGANVGLSGTRFDTVFANTGNFSALIPLTLNGLTVGAGSGLIAVGSRFLADPATTSDDAPITAQQDHVSGAHVDPANSNNMTNVGALLRFVAADGIAAGGGSGLDYPVVINTSTIASGIKGAVKVELTVGGTTVRGWMLIHQTPQG